MITPLNISRRAIWKKKILMLVPHNLPDLNPGQQQNKVSFLDPVKPVVIASGKKKLLLESGQ